MRRLALALILCLAAPAAAQEAAPVEVDLQLVLAVDVSRSMSPRELEIQRRGYAEALTSSEVLGTIRAGPLGRIALTYVEWAGDSAHRVVVDWTLVASEADARAVAARITGAERLNMRRTSISGALTFAHLRLGLSPFAGWRQVIDISGDGPNNQGRPVLAARDDVLAAGVTINGLPLMTRDGAGGQWQLDDLDLYYRDCVIGGPGAFVIPVRDWSEFPGAVRRKLVLEISGLAAAGLHQAQLAVPGPGYDCLIGERIRERERLYWNSP